MVSLMMIPLAFMFTGVIYALFEIADQIKRIADKEK